MATLLKQGNRFYVQFFDKARTPVRKRVSVKTTTKRTAEQLKRKLEDAWVLGEFDPWLDDPLTYGTRPKATKPKTVSEALGIFLAAKDDAGRSENTLRSYRDVVNLLIAQVGETTLLEKLSADDIQTFIRSGGVSKTTLHNRYRHVRGFINWCHKEKLCARNPINGVEPPSRPETLPKAVTKDE